MSARVNNRLHQDKGHGDGEVRGGSSEKMELLPGATELNSPCEEINGIAEKQTLLMENSRLNPEWEANTEKTAAQLSFKDTVQEAPPVDRWQIVYFILLLHGVGTLMPWNMFINANAYFVSYKLAGNSTDIVLYRRYFLSFLGVTSQVPNVLLNGLNIFCRCKGGSVSVRIVWSIIIVVIMFIITVILAMIDSSTWPATFFWITMITVIIINMANGVYQNSVYGTAAFLPMKYTNAVVLGSNVSGTFTAVLNIMSIASSPDPRTSAIYYFLGAILILLIAFDTYFVLPLTKFFRFYSQRAKQNVTNNSEENKAEDLTTLEIFKKCWQQYLCVFLVFFVTLSIFPAVQANVKRSNPNFFISEKYFAPVFCFLFFNFFAMVGNLTTEWVRQPGPQWVWLPVVLRVLFIPFLIFCNYLPDNRSLPVIINNDYIYIAGAVLMAFSHGYFSSLTMMYAPRSVPPVHQGTAGMMAAFFLVLGVLSGIVFSFPLIYFVQHI